MTTRLRGPLLVSALGAALLLLLTTERPADEPHSPSPVAEVAKSLPEKPPVPATKSEGSFPPAASAPAAPPPEPPRPLVLKTIDPPQKGGLAPELLPVAAAPQTPPEPPVAPPPAATPTANPNSVFGWGPWTGDTPSDPSSSAPQGASSGAPGVSGLPRNVSSSSSGGNPAASPPVVTPPPAASNVRPGHGFGDQNHTHIHRGR